VPLTALKAGQTGVICEARLDVDDAALLRAMGLADRVRVKLCRVGEPCVVALGNVEGKHCHCNGHCRIGLARGLAERIFVTVVA
jgi:Fe2+ transport system protein FeoA